MKLAMQYGASVGVATGAWMYLEYVLGFHEPDGIGRWTGFISLLFPVIGALLLVRRESVPDWGAAFAQGAVFGSMGGLLGALAILCYFTLINPRFSVGGRPVDPMSQATIGFVGALVLGVILVPLIRLFAKQGSADV